MGVGRNLYVDLDAFRRQFVNNLALDASDATEIERAIEAASRHVDQLVRRPDGFYATTDTRYFAGDGHDYITIPDLLAVTTIKLDEDGNRTFELTLAAATDYYLKRFGYVDEDAPPWSRLVLDGVNGQRSSFTSRARLVEIAGRWGYSEDTETVEASGTAITGTLADAGADLTLAVSADADLAVGQTLKLENEQVYVSGDAGALLWTVVRAVNGTTGAAHSAVAVSRYKYPAQVRDATMMLAGKHWTRRGTGMGQVVAGTPLAGGSDPGVEKLLAPFVRWSTMVA